VRCVISIARTRHDVRHQLSWCKTQKGGKRWHAAMSRRKQNLSTYGKAARKEQRVENAI